MLSLNDVATLAPQSINQRDPDLCAAKSAPDPNEFLSETELALRLFVSIHTKHSQPIFAPGYRTRYARIAPKFDRPRCFAKVLNFLKITDARSFASTVTVTGDGQGGVKYPQLVPFSYLYDQAKSTYNVQTIGKGSFLGQVTSSFDIQYSYNVNKALSINTVSLFSNITTAIAGAGSASSLLSPAANAYLSASQTVLQNLSDSVFKEINTAT